MPKRKYLIKKKINNVKVTINTKTKIKKINGKK